VRKPPSRPGRTDRVGQLLFVATQAAQSLATERLAPLRLSPREWGVLSTLVESGPLTQIELATALAVDRTAMVYLIDELEERELVRRDRKPGDRRSFLITLTDNGRNTQRKAAAALRTGAEALLEPLEEAERTQLVALLGAIVEHWQAGQA